MIRGEKPFKSDGEQALATAAADGRRPLFHYKKMSGSPQFIIPE